MKRTGLLHLYYGDGKGKTTAAMGLALRAMGSGKRVVILQFLKGGKSGEVPLLEQLGAKVYRGKAGQKFVFQMNEAEKEATRQLQNANLTAAMADPADLLILDEAGSAWELDMVDKALLQKAVLERPAEQECVLTAHAAPQWMLDAADSALYNIVDQIFIGWSIWKCCNKHSVSIYSTCTWISIACRRWSCGRI